MKAATCIAIVFIVVYITYKTSKVIERHFYSKFIKEFLSMKEEHFIILSNLDKTYEAGLIKMEKILEHKRTIDAYKIKDLRSNEMEETKQDYEEEFVK